MGLIKEDGGNDRPVRLDITSRVTKIEMLREAREAAYEYMKTATLEYYDADAAYREAKAVAFLKHKLVEGENVKAPSDKTVEMLMDRDTTKERKRQRVAKANYENARSFFDMLSQDLSVEQSLLSFERALT
jgi:hypothetical protein